MPFMDEKQRKLLFSQKPGVAKKFVAHSDKKKSEKDLKTTVLRARAA